VLAFLVGVVLLVTGLLRGGWIADLLSIPVTIGFLAGISIHIIVGQAPEILGVDVPHGRLPSEVMELVRQLPHANPYPVAIGLAVLVVAIAAERISRLVPGALIGLLLASVAVAVFGLQAHGVKTLGTLVLEPPRLAIDLPNWREFTRLASVAVIVAIICVMQTAAVVRSFPDNPSQPENVSRDFAAVGLGSILAAAVGAFAVNTSPPRTAVVQESGGKSQLVSLLAIVIAVAIALLASGAFAYVPTAALSGILVFIGVRIFRVATMRVIYQHGGYEFLLVLASAACVVLLPIETGVTMSILLSLVHSIYIIARPDCAVLSRVPGTTVWWQQPAGSPGEHEPGVLVFAPGAPIHFTNAAYVRGRLRHEIAAMREPCRLVVIEAHGVIDIDFTGSQVLQQEIAELRERGIRVVWARIESERAERAAVTTGLVAALGPDCVFKSVEEAIRAAKAG
jgi:MFS superfamily sulfate permease-like transporter